MTDPDFRTQPPMGHRPLSDLDDFERRAEFQGWLAREYIHRQAVPEFFSDKERAAVYQQFVAEHPNWEGVTRGTTPQELVLSGQLVFGVPLSIVIRSTPPLPDLKRVRRKEILEPEALVELLVRVCLRDHLKTNSAVRAPRYVVLVYDGEIGHVISISHLVPGRPVFVFYDTWPGRSLLCRENNVALVDAKPHDDGEAGWWQLSVRDLLKVIYGVLVPASIRESWKLEDRKDDRAAIFARVVMSS